MADPFLAEVRIFAGDFAPMGWALCDGQLLPISQNTALFSLLGTQYGGDGKTNFALPNFQGAAPMHQGQGPGLTSRSPGESGGEPSVTLTTAQIPTHTHPAKAFDGTGDQNSPAGMVWATARQGRQALAVYSSTPGTSPTMNPGALSVTGGDVAHNNMHPYLALTFIIALQGIYPPRS